MLISEQQPRATSAVHHISTLPSRISAGAWLGSRWFYAVKLGVVSWGVVIAFAFLDAIVSGGISLVLRYDSWTMPDQLVSRLYQLGFGVFVLAALVYLFCRGRKVFLLSGVLFFGLWEDLLYYVLLPAAWPVIEFVIRDGWTGPGYAGIYFPQHVAGWPHWLGKVLFGKDIIFMRTEWALWLIGSLLLWAAMMIIAYRTSTRAVRKNGVV